MESFQTPDTDAGSRGDGHQDSLLLYRRQQRIQRPHASPQDCRDWLARQEECQGTTDNSDTPSIVLDTNPHETGGTADSPPPPPPRDRCRQRRNRRRHLLSRPASRFSRLPRSPCTWGLEMASCPVPHEVLKLECKGAPGRPKMGHPGAKPSGTGGGSCLPPGDDAGPV